MDNINYTLIAKWMKELDANKLFCHLQKRVKWEQTTVKIYGKAYKAPRLTSFFGNVGIRYQYSGVTHLGEGWPDWLTPLVERVQTFCNTEFNGCLLNLYRNGSDCMGWHADNEKELDNKSSIASLSLGVRRDLYFKNNFNLEKECVSLGNGDLLIMHPLCQNNCLHSIPRRRKIKEKRINLTFRKYKY